MNTWKVTPNGHGGYLLSNGRAMPGGRAAIHVQDERRANTLAATLNAAERIAELNMPAQITKGALSEEQDHDDSLKTLRVKLSKL